MFQIPSQNPKIRSLLFVHNPALRYILYVFLEGWGAQGDLCTATISGLFCSPIYFLIIPDSSTTALWQLPADTPSSEAGETWRENGC
jgi:hypothetical protein